MTRLVCQGWIALLPLFDVRPSATTILERVCRIVLSNISVDWPIINSFDLLQDMFHKYYCRNTNNNIHFVVR